MSFTPRRRRVASLATAATLALGLPALGGTVLAGPAQSAVPAADCTAPFPVDEVAVGDEVDGLTVVSGTTPTGFTGDVLGVLADGIAPGVDMIMVDLDMPEFTNTGGVWQGMSGSPVYAADGRLIGAVAYGLSYGPSPIAGVTPFAEMDDYLAAAPVPRTVPLSGADARTVAARAGITTAQAEQGLRELPMPMGVTGITARRLAQLQNHGPDFVEKSSYVLGRATAAAAGAETVVAGGNIAASVSYGDITMAGVGTATSVCDGRVVGFGHPLAYLGSTTLGLHPADAVYIQPDSLGSPFKVANIAPPVGTITDDRLTGITGGFGTLPEAATITSDVTYDGRARTGTSDVLVQDFAGEVTFYQMIANQDRVLDGPATGSELLTWTITGTDQGEPFSLSYTDRWSGRYLLEEPSFSVAGVVEILNSLEGVTIGSVTAAADVDDDLTTHTVVGMEQLRGGSWARITKKAPAVGRQGRTVRLRVVLGGSAGRQYVTLDPITIRRRAQGALALVVQGGNDLYYESASDSVDALRTSLAAQQRHDQVRVQLGTPNRVQEGYGSEDEFFFRGQSRRPRKPYSFVQTVTPAPVAHVVEGSRRLTLVVR
ncbi:SpoIVB peptidase S55 domain-containing protein [Nocardioides rubriscoriae]|uniref:SpoIVB peptidase S55 domain-containing protein n=1 Tax=Nocardioides rubriscoriae TaxID=642762 RepID=UPI0014795B0F|nr:SpoIVB peptidase S55 domain-containing protein [Nocardioides rubriscoriae]